MNGMDRRDTVRLMGAAALFTSGIAGAAPQTEETRTAAFDHGIASGDPLSDRVILWTRATPPNGNTPPQVAVDWKVAIDRAFKRIVRQGIAATGPERDYTVKVDVDGLKPNTRYHYRFRCGATTSPAGRTQTLPVGRQASDLVIAVASCSFYATGFFNAYREIAKLQRIDLVLHLGDYIYDYGAAADQLGMSIGLKIGRIPRPANETITLADYRGRYACYREDPDLQAAHARAPWICVWDDHESANDSWMGGAQNHQPNEGEWAARRAAAVRAYYEWIPIRDPEAGRPFEAINRTFELGDLATLVMLESRLMARSRQLSLSNPEDLPRRVVDISDAAHPRLVTDAAIVERVLAAARTGAVPAPYAIRPDLDALRGKLADPARQLLGAEQEAWLQAELVRSVKAGKRWQVIGNQVVMARVQSPDVVGAMGAERWQAARAELPDGIRGAVESIVKAGKALPYGLDAWNGYPAARTRMDDILSGPGTTPLVLSGDSHAFWVNELTSAPGKMIAAEIGTSAISSSSLGDLLGGFDIGRAFAADNEEVLYCNQIMKGFTLLTLNALEARADLIAVSTVLSRDYTTQTIASFSIKPAEGGGIKPIRQV